MNRSKGFTLTELMVVVILIGIIAAFALPNYSKSIAKAHERDAIVQLMAIHAASLIYHAQADKFPQEISTLEEINRELGLNVIANGMLYHYSSPAANPDEFEATAQWPGSDSFTVLINQSPIGKDINPCCSDSDGECPSLPQCSEIIELPR